MALSITFRRTCIDFSNPCTYTASHRTAQFERASQHMCLKRPSKALAEVVKVNERSASRLKTKKSLFTRFIKFSSYGNLFSWLFVLHGDHVGCVCSIALFDRSQGIVKNLYCRQLSNGNEPLVRPACRDAVR
jgi:hypothetical protein